MHTEMNTTLPVIKLGISPCPNDTFAFYQLLNLKDDLPFRIETVIADVEELNRRVLENHLDISKVSFHLFAHVAERYRLLNYGSALGRGCGPLLLSSKDTVLSDLTEGTVALPGKYTTAAMLFRMFMTQQGINVSDTIQMNFAEIPGAVASGRVRGGVVIHETRFTYRKQGLYCLKDLGEWWENTTSMPIPLGGIIAKKRLPEELVRQFDKALAESIQYAFRHPSEALSFCERFAQEMSHDVMKKHIDLYVNNFTRDLGDEGRKAIRFMFEYGAENGLFKATEPEFA